jgi:nitrate/nitrite transporter NarK
VTVSSLIFGMILQPIYGALSDRIGRKWLLIAFGVCGVVFTIPLLTTLQAVKGPLAAFLLIAAAWMIVSGRGATKTNRLDAPIDNHGANNGQNEHDDAPSAHGSPQTPAPPSAPGGHW